MYTVNTINVKDTLKEIIDCRIKESSSLFFDASSFEGLSSNRKEYILSNIMRDLLRINNMTNTQLQFKKRYIFNKNYSELKCTYFRLIKLALEIADDVDGTSILEATLWIYATAIQLAFEG